MGEAEVSSLETIAHERSKLLDQVRSGKRLMIPENLLLQLFSIEWAQLVDDYQREAFQVNRSDIFLAPPFIEDQEGTDLLQIASANMGGYDDEIEDSIIDDDIYTYMVEHRENGEDSFVTEERIQNTRLRYTARAVLVLSGVFNNEQSNTSVGVA